MSGAFPQLPQEWKEAFGSGTFPEFAELYRQQLEAKKKSRIIIKKDEVKWDTRHPQARSASLVDPRLGFANSLVNLGLSEIDPGSHTGQHKHGEAIVYILSGRGYSIIQGQRYDWEEGDALYIPPDVYHQHFNLDPEKPARYLRVVPGPIGLNLLALAATLNLAPAYGIEQAQARPGYEATEFEALKGYLKGS